MGTTRFLQDAGYKSLQRLVFADINGGLLVALFPGELKPHAMTCTQIATQKPS